MIRKQECTKLVITIIVGCVSIFIVGIVLLSLGWSHYRSEPPPLPYVYSLSICPVPSTTSSEYPMWVGEDVLNSTQHICQSDTTKSTFQTFHIPKHVLDEGIKYQPVVYITTNIEGEIVFLHKAGDKTIFSGVVNFKQMLKEEFAYCGGKEIQIYREAMDNKVSGEYITRDCMNVTSGCTYEPSRSMNSFQFINSYDVVEIPEEGSNVQIEITLKSTENMIGADPFQPDVLIEFRASGLGLEQKKGLILMIVGGIMADLMPATLFFMLQKFYFKKPNVPVSDDLAGMIPLMEM